MTDELLVDPGTLRQQVRDKYRDVALDPHAEHHFLTRTGGVLQFADIANGRPVTPEALRDIDLWTG